MSCSKLSELSRKFWTIYGKNFLVVAVKMALVFGVLSGSSLAQNPWGGSGISKAQNAGSNTLVFLTWLSFLIGLVAMASIAVCIYFEMNYKKNIWVAVMGVGGFAIMGSIAYDIVNLSSINMDTPTMGN